jgi:hypothetical protein
VPATIIDRTVDTVTVQIQIPLSSTSLLASEESILAAINDVGTIASAEAMQKFDTDGSKLERAGLKWSSKGQQPKTYQTPYGAIEVCRHVYQSSAGGQTLTLS